LRKLITGVIAALTTSGGAAAVVPAVASAYGPSYCNASSCILSGNASTGQEYFELPRGAGEQMLCWTDAQWYDGTNRWFKVQTIYGRGFTVANEVSNQTRVGHC
jgi:hypothetical protein